MSNHLPTAPPHASDDALVERLDELGRDLVAAEIEALPASAPASDTPFMQAVARRARFHTAGRLAPRLALAAAAAIALVGGYLIVASRPPTAPPPIASNNSEDSQTPTLGNLRKLNQDVTSPDQLKLAGGSAANPSNPTTPDPRSLSPIDARTPDRIDAIMGGK